MRTQSERYREAVRATHLIANEMADIENEDEFDEMLNFVLTQWRNVRQRKRGDCEDTGNGGGETNSRQPRANDTSEESITRVEVDGSSNGSEDDSEAGSNDNPATDQGKVCQPHIRLNPKSKKVGAPRKLKKNTVAVEKEGRKWYEAAESGRKIAGEVTLLGLLNALERDKPGLHETQRRLSGLIVRHTEHENKKPKMKVCKNPVLVQDPFYLLPTKLLEACLKVLPVSNTASSAISIDDSQSSQGVRKDNDASGEQKETVLIKDVGQFSRQQIETFKRVMNLKDAVEKGLDTYKWMTETGISALSAEYHALGKSIAENVKNTYPYKCIDGLPNDADFQYAMLYRAMPPMWLSDACIRAVCVRLCQDYPQCRFAGFQSAKAKTKRTRDREDSVLSADIRDRVLRQVKEEGVESVFLPLNFGNLHWCCVVVKVHTKRIYYYDPLNHTSYKSAANAVAVRLKVAGLNDYEPIPMNNPLQFDGFSCGVYVCWMFIRQITYGHLDMNDATLPKRRFELFIYLLTGRLLPAEAAAADLTELKPIAPQSDDNNIDDDEAAPTQAADK
ncbi:hypothetical protein DVH05_002022 [Phytophthora capsici]|nr:hypothetical protein DVH05_002022 [Phytophthora capsici]